MKVTGATVHFVNAELDAGPIVLQSPVLVQPHDTADTLAARILVEEHRLYPEAIRLVLDGGVEGRRPPRDPAVADGADAGRRGRARSDFRLNEPDSLQAARQAGQRILGVVLFDKDMSNLLSARHSQQCVDRKCALRQSPRMHREASSCHQ